LGVVAEIANEIVVMYAGRVVRARAPTRQLFYDPQHRTRGLLGSIPRLDRPKQERLHSIEGDAAVADQRSRGCKFRPRCPTCISTMCTQEPELRNRSR